MRGFPYWMVTIMSALNRQESAIPFRIMDRVSRIFDPIFITMIFVVSLPVCFDYIIIRSMPLFIVRSRKDDPQRVVWYQTHPELSLFLKRCREVDHHQ